MKWVEREEVRKVYKGKIIVQIKERKDFEIWKKDKEIQMIDEEGEKIVKLSKGS